MQEEADGAKLGPCAIYHCKHDLIVGMPYRTLFDPQKSCLDITAMLMVHQRLVWAVALGAVAWVDTAAALYVLPTCQSSAPYH